MGLVLDFILETKARSNGCHEHIIHDFTNIREVETFSLRSLWPSSPAATRTQLAQRILGELWSISIAKRVDELQAGEWVAKAIVFLYYFCVVASGCTFSELFCLSCAWGVFRLHGVQE